MNFVFEEHPNDQLDHPDQPDHPDRPDHPDQPDHPDHPDQPDYPDHPDLKLDKMDQMDQLDHSDQSNHSDNLNWSKIHNNIYNNMIMEFALFIRRCIDGDKWFQWLYELAITIWRGKVKVTFLYFGGTWLKE